VTLIFQFYQCVLLLVGNSGTKFEDCMAIYWWNMRGSMTLRLISLTSSFCSWQNLYEI